MIPLSSFGPPPPRGTCQKCKEAVRGMRQNFDLDKGVVVLTGTCRCGFQRHEIPIPKQKLKEMRKYGI